MNPILLDHKARDLHDRLIDIEYEFLSHIKPTLSAKFIEDTTDYVWDDTHFQYESIIFPTVEEKKPINPTQKQLYMNLVLLCHPDKCNRSWAHELFSLLGNANEKNDIAFMEKMQTYYELHKSFDGFILQHFEEIKKKMETEKQRELAEQQERERVQREWENNEREKQKAEELQRLQRAHEKEKEQKNETENKREKEEEKEEQVEQGEQKKQEEQEKQKEKEPPLSTPILTKLPNETGPSIAVKEEQIRVWKAQIWYVWYYPSPLTQTAKDIFVKKEVYSERVQKKLDELKKWNDMINQYPHLSSTIAKPIVWRDRN